MARRPRHIQSTKTAVGKRFAERHEKLRSSVHRQQSEEWDAKETSAYPIDQEKKKKILLANPSITEEVIINY